VPDHLDRLDQHPTPTGIVDRVEYAIAGKLNNTVAASRGLS
jgi:hypothetical protein